MTIFPYLANTPYLPATIDSIETSIFEALVQLNKKHGGVFATVDRYAGQVSKTEGVNASLLLRTPGVLLAFDGEQAQEDFVSVTGAAETRGRSVWTILVITADVREQSKALKGTTGASGVYSLASTVLGAINQLVIPGLIRSKHLVYQGTIPVIMQAGKAYVVAIKFTADRSVEAAPDPLTVHPPPAYGGSTGSEHLVEATGAPDPIVQLKDS